MTTQISVETLSPITYNQIPVITTELLAQVYGAKVKNISDNFLNNISRFVADKHYFKIEKAELREFKNRPETIGLVGKNARSLILWTERGAARHAKMLETEQAWEVFEKLEDFYFSQKEKTEQVRKSRQCTATQLIPLRQTAERLITTGLGKIYPDIWKLVHQRFDVDHIHQLQPEQVGEAIEYLNVLEGEYLGKQSHLPAISFKNDYSMEFFKGYLWMIGEKSIRAPWCYPADLLSGNGDYPNPCGRLLSELKQQGYNVEAAQFQLLALQHHLEIHRNRMEAIQREIGGLGYR